MESRQDAGRIECWRGGVRRRRRHAAGAPGATPLARGPRGGGPARLPCWFPGPPRHKPEFGRVPVWPHAGGPTLSHFGPIARTIEDAAPLLTAIAGFDIRDPAAVAA